MRKNLLALIAAFFVITESSAQVTEDKNPALSLFEGTWKWCGNGDTLIIMLQKQMIYYTNYYRMERLIGWHKYIKSNKQVESSLQYVGSNYNDNRTGRIASSTTRFTLIGGLQKSNDLFFSFYDLTLRKEMQLWCSPMPESKGRLNCRLVNIEDAGTAADAQCTLPQNFILIKEK